MAVPKVVGIETEYGIALRGGDPNPIAASSILINAYVNHLQRKVGWDFEDESPGRDARGFARDGSSPPEVETHLVNAVLTNGARYYVDHAHPEYSSPECRDALSIVKWDRAGERILQKSMELAESILPGDQHIAIYKNNSDGKGNSYGCHENYLMDRAVPFATIVNRVMPFFVTRQIFTGSGKVGSEVPGVDGIPFQITQRADFFEEEVGLETTLKRPIVNTRDEPHADTQLYRRLHVICGDANMAEVATFLKVGATAFVLAMIEDDVWGDRDLSLATPVPAMRQVSNDLTLKRPLELETGATMTALAIQWEYLGLARKWAEEHGCEAVGGDEVGQLVLDRWEQVLAGLETDPMTLNKQLDWVAKYQLIDAYRERNGMDWSNARLRAMDLHYHDLRPAKSLFARMSMEKLVAAEDVEEAVTEPPRDTRAYFRGRCLQRWGSSIAAANWDSIVFDLGTDPLRRIGMMEPLKGTAAIVDRLLESCATPAELLERLGS
ncbi:MAG TPA: depupylase/deamidase Dop [Acidimicrobiales bacterium]|nr:depupylase/deamidase Dop [Acidimicrobiales bacterium]